MMTAASNPMTLGNLRANGVRTLAAWCSVAAAITQSG
jgi:hypothetical protein